MGMVKKRQQKGRDLEKATAFIHEALLKNNPLFSTASFTIETRKMLTVSGVPQEIDVLVTPVQDSPFLGKVIFECKDWNKAVDKKEVVLLADKVEALSASKGILVARSITKGAKARLAQNSRLSFIQCCDDFRSPLDDMEFVHTWHDFLPLKIFIKQRGVAAKDFPEILDHSLIKCLLNGGAIDFMGYIDRHLQNVVEVDRKRHNRMYSFEGNHWRQEAFEVVFDRGEFLVDGREIETMQMVLTYWVEVRRQKIISKFELEKQGRAFFFDPIVDSKTGEKYEIQMVQLI